MSPKASTGTSTFRASGKRWYIGFTNPDDQLGHMTALGMAALQALQPQRLMYDTPPLDIEDR